MNAVVLSYFRSIRRGVRTLESVPVGLRDQVRALLEAK